MKRTATLFETFDAYLSKRLTGRGLSNFEQMLESDTALQEALEAYKLVGQALTDDDSIAFRQKLIAIEGGFEHEKENSDRIKIKSVPLQKNNKTYWYVAATITVLMVVSSLMWKPKAENTTLFKANYLPYPTADITRGVKTHGKVLDKAMAVYKVEEYAKAIPLLEAQIQESPNDALLKLYLGNSYLNTNQENKALLLFKSIPKASNHYEDAQWFLGLIYLKIEKAEEAKKQFQGLSLYPNLYKAKALKILEVLE